MTIGFDAAIILLQMNKEKKYFNFVPSEKNAFLVRFSSFCRYANCIGCVAWRQNNSQTIVDMLIKVANAAVIETECDLHSYFSLFFLPTNLITVFSFIVFFVCFHVSTICITYVSVTNDFSNVQTFCSNHIYCELLSD